MTPSELKVVEDLVGSSEAGSGYYEEIWWDVVVDALRSAWEERDSFKAELDYHRDNGVI